MGRFPDYIGLHQRARAVWPLAIMKAYVVAASDRNVGGLITMLRKNGYQIQIINGDKPSEEDFPGRSALNGCMKRDVISAIARNMWDVCLIAAGDYGDVEEVFEAAHMRGVSTEWLGAREREARDERLRRQYRPRVISRERENAPIEGQMGGVRGLSASRHASQNGVWRRAWPFFNGGDRGGARGR